MNDKIKVTNSEWYVMNCLWTAEQSLPLMQIVPLLKQSNGWSEKGLIGYNEQGKTKYFFPKVNKEDVVVQETKDFLQRIYDGSVGTMMSALVRQNDLSLDDIHELQQILKDAESKAKKSKE